MVADTKKCQTLINKIAIEAGIMREAMARLVAVRDQFLTHNPDTTGTALDGNLATINAAMNTLQPQVDLEIWTTIIAAYVPTHRCMALE